MRFNAYKQGVVLGTIGAYGKLSNANNTYGGDGSSWDAFLDVRKQSAKDLEQEINYRAAVIEYERLYGSAQGVDADKIVVPEEVTSDDVVDEIVASGGELSLGQFLKYRNSKDLSDYKVMLSGKVVRCEPDELTGIKRFIKKQVSSDDNTVLNSFTKRADNSGLSSKIMNYQQGIKVGFVEHENNKVNLIRNQEITKGTEKSTGDFDGGISAYSEIRAEDRDISNEYKGGVGGKRPEWMDENMKVYGTAGTYFDLSEDQKLDNAIYIYHYLRGKLWSKKAICGLLGNIEHESGFNPGAWQHYDANDEIKAKGGYGLVQWDSAKKKILLWLEKSVVDVDKMVVEDPKLLIEIQLDLLIDSCRPEKGEWIAAEGNVGRHYNARALSDGSRPLVSFYEYINNSERRAGDLALIFNSHYERSADWEVEQAEKRLEKRYNLAEKWYEYFKDWD